VPDDLGRRVDRHGLNALDGLLPAADVVVTALHADRYVLAAEHAPLLDRGRPVLVLDLAMPRNVAPELAVRVPSLELVDLDGLKRWHRREQVDLPHLRGLCRDLVLGHREYYDKLVHSFQGWNAE
jgi:glutamyl-tRNA reductase